MSAAAMITRRNASTAKQVEPTRELVEEKKAALLQQLLKEEADAVERRDQEEEKEKLRKMLAEAEKITKEKKASSHNSVKEKKAKAEELLALIGRQAASGADQQDKDAILMATLLARSARSDKAIEDLKADVRSLEADRIVRRELNAVLSAGAVIYFFYWLFH